MVREESIESFYTRLRDSASTSPLPVFPSTSDVDSLCALKIIGHVLESDSVTPFPVLKRFIRDLNKNDRVIVLYTRDDEQQADLAYDFDVSALANASDLNSDDEFEDESDSESENDDIEREEEDRDEEGFE
ncbi:hypothetical protein CQW23_08656 [Capsicum baccatum]|uniref:Uncharacterized protein n=1 Tax=Capsicum baccatum TaxID=33114 RepID=A0A2G2X9K3_CAPBA|nr:hypothetical protein CQW23_08656 [Capsicum baccatum]